MADMTGLIEELEDWRDRVTDIAAQIVVDETIGAAPDGPPREGGGPKLRDTIRIENTGPGQWTIIAEAEHAEYTDKGTQGPYIIRATSARVLRFEWANGPEGPGEYHFPYVTHPGIAAQNWFEEPMEERWIRALETAAQAYG